MNQSDAFHSENAGATRSASNTLERTTSQILEDSDHRALERHLSLFDLVSIGVGGTIGSGIFVLCGLIANQYAGPATCLSWAIAGVAAFLSGFCYAELSGRIPSAGSSYAYAHESMGEFVAFLTAACLTLEFLVSGSAVARSWGDKVVEWLNVELNAGPWASRLLDPGYNINPLAFLVSACCTALILCGVKESKLVTDFFTWTKVLLVCEYIYSLPLLFTFQTFIIDFYSNQNLIFFVYCLKPDRLHDHRRVSPFRASQFNAIYTA